MTVALLFALIGSVILVGFLANLLFRLTKIPSVLLLIAIGVFLGPVTGWIRHDLLLAIAPYFGAAALLVILFEGGLELELGHVLRHAPMAAGFAVVVFGTSMAATSLVGHFALGLPWTQALMLGAILGATSPAICMPVVSGLSVRREVKTVIKLESVIGEVLLIVSVVLLIDSHGMEAARAAGPAGWAWGFLRSTLVALAVATVAGVLWSRLVGWLGREPLAYMLTLGIVCLLYFVVEELGGSPAIAILLFGLILANMQEVASRFGSRVRDIIGIDFREEQFALGQFMVNITTELSFLVRTFFFVYLGLLLDLSSLSWSVAGWLAVVFALLLICRRFGVAAFRRMGVAFEDAEWRAIMALQPRGLATAVVAFMPIQAGVDGTALFPMFAFVVIVLSNLYMTGGVVLAERRLKAKGAVVHAAEASAETLAPPAAEVAPEPAPSEPHRPPLFSPARDFEDEPPPVRPSDWIARIFGLRQSDREAEYVEMVRASFLGEPLFWVQAAIGAAICTLGLLLGQPAIVIGAALIVPLVRTVIATGLALASGDLYLLAKLLGKLVAFSASTALVAALFGGLLPLAADSNEILARTRPTILDFLVALFGGMSGAALVSLRRGAYHYLPGAVVAITLLPPLCVVGFGLSGNVGAAALNGAALQFSANLFASILGAAIVLLAVGVPLAAQSPSIVQWKAEALEEPLAHAVFGRLGLQRLIGRTGSVRARLIVVAIFLLLLVTPLQLALNELQLEYRTRQAIANAQALFAVPNRSVVAESKFEIRGSGVDVRLVVTTNGLFSAGDIARFEERVGDQTGLRCRLNLVQTLGSVGDTDTLQRIFSRPAARPTDAEPSVGASLRALGVRVSRLLAQLPVPVAAEIVAVRAGLLDQDAGRIELTYLAERALSDDARSMLASLVAAQAGVGVDHVAVEWIPSTYAITVRRGHLEAPAASHLETLGRTLVRFDGLDLELAIPERWPAATTAAVRAEVAAILGREVPAGAQANLHDDGAQLRVRLVKDGPE